MLVCKEALNFTLTDFKRNSLIKFERKVNSQIFDLNNPTSFHNVRSHTLN